MGQVNLVGVVGTAGLQGSVGADAYVCAIVQALQRKKCACKHVDEGAERDGGLT